MGRSHSSAFPGQSISGFQKGEFIRLSNIFLRKPSVIFVPVEDQLISSTLAQSARGFMGVHSSTPHVLFRFGEGIQPCSSWCFVRDALGHPQQRVVQYMYNLLPALVGTLALFIVNIDRIYKSNQELERLWFGNLCLIFADDVVLFA